ncbi:MAG: hypothetical protein ACP5N2_04225 [Candidatus Nanoarchaeia archaeon]
MALGWGTRLKIRFFTKKKIFNETIVSPEAISITDERIAEKITSTQIDLTNLHNLSSKHASNILKSKKLNQKIDDRKDANKLELINDEKKYLKYLKRQIKDLQKIIELSREIVENEHISMLSDARRPLIILEKYKHELISGLKNVKLEESVRNDIAYRITQVEKSYEDFLSYILGIISELKNISFDALREDSDLVSIINNRAETKKRLSGKYLSLDMQLKNLKEHLTQLGIKNQLNPGVVIRLMSSIREFAEKFEELDDFIKRRELASLELIQGNILLQKKKEEELAELHTEIKRIIPSFEPSKKSELNNDDNIILAVENEDERLLSEENRIGQMTVNALVSDRSRVHSEGPVSAEKVGSPMDVWRNKFFSWILVGTIVAETIAPTAILATNKGDPNSLVLFGTPEQIENGLIGENVDMTKVSPAFISQQAKIIASKSVVINIKTSGSRPYSPDFSGKEGLTNVEQARDDFMNPIIKAINDTTFNIKNDIYKQLSKTNLTKEQKDTIVDQAGNLSINWLPNSADTVTGFTSPEGTVRNPTATNNNYTLSEVTAAKYFEDVVKVGLNSLQHKVPGLKVDSSMLSKVKVVGGGPIFKHKCNLQAVNALNSFTSKMNRSDLTINYGKMSTGDKAELTKLDESMILLRNTNMAHYQEVSKLMDPARKIEFVGQIKVDVVVYGSGSKPIPVPLLPVGVLAVRQGPTHNPKNNLFIPTSTGKVNAGYAPIIKKNIPKLVGNHRVNTRVPDRTAKGSKSFQKL